MRYSFDTSSFVESWRRIYPRDVFPSLWDEHLPGLIASGDLRASKQVKVELERQDDELLAWANDQDDLFIEADASVQAAVSAIMASHGNLVQAHGGGRSGGDPFVIALAQVSGAIVVTEEKPRSVINPKIPDVCNALGIQCINMLGVIRQKGWTYRA